MIDIIIPAYNAHETIEKSLMSLSMQTIKEKLNVYIIDDCSKKDYADIVKKFENIIRIKQLKLEKNSGPGVARQFGINNSNGNYILFLDSDDLLYDSYSLEYLLNAISEHDCDMAIGMIIDQQKETLIQYQNHSGCLHGKLYKRKFISENNIHFNESRSSEDNGFNKLMIMHLPKTNYVNKCVYLYKYNDKSITQSDHEEYNFYSLESYIYNMVWATNEAINRNCSEIEISKNVCASYYYCYYVYLQYLNKSDLNLIFKWIKPLNELYSKYKNIITDSEKLELFNGYKQLYPKIPPVSLKDFENMVDICK